MYVVVYFSAESHFPQNISYYKTFLYFYCFVFTLCLCALLPPCLVFLLPHCLLPPCLVSFIICNSQDNFSNQRHQFALSGTNQPFNGDNLLFTPLICNSQDNFSIQRHQFALSGTIPSLNARNLLSMVQIDFFTTRICSPRH